MRGRSARRRFPDWALGRLPLQTDTVDGGQSPELEGPDGSGLVGCVGFIFIALVVAGCWSLVTGGEAEPRFPSSVVVQNGEVRQCDAQGNVIGIGDFQFDAERLCSTPLG